MLHLKQRVKHKRTYINGFKPHYLSFILVTIKLYCRKISIIKRYITMHNYNYQQLYYTVFDLCSNWVWTLRFHHFLEKCYRTFTESYNIVKHFLSLISIKNIYYSERQLFSSIFENIVSSKVIRNHSLLLLQYLFLKTCSCLNYIHFQPFCIKLK